MPLVAGYHRPTTLDEAIELLADPNRVILAGGTSLNADREHSDLEAVDLQALGLDTIEAEAEGEAAGDRLRIGSMATLAVVAADERIPEALRRLAAAEQPSTLRTVATLGGVVAAGESESLLLAALLVHDTTVELAGGPATPLAELLADGLAPHSIITGITIATGGVVGHVGTARTPADRPIVAAVARRVGDTVTLALTGVAPTPVLVDAASPTEGLEPPDDFRGSSVYRMHLAATLAERALEVTS